METINETHIMTYNSENENLVNDIKIRAGLHLSKDKGHIVKSYQELLFKIANLNFYNERFQLLFRGQTKDYLVNSKVDKSNLYPSILRPHHNQFVSKERKQELNNNFRILKLAEDCLITEFGENIWGNNRILKWAILQHYEVCPTPLLDVTNSIQTALSFAIGKNNEGYLYVLGFPQSTGPISISIESKTQIIDLAQICPPEALRPHFQNGILVGDYPEFTTLDQTKGKRATIGHNFACRLMTKFHIKDCDKWDKEGFTKITDNLLFPNSKDIFFKRIQKVKNLLQEKI